MMLHKKSSNSHLLKLFALVPIVGITLAINAEKVQEIVYTPANNVPDAVTTATEQAPADQEDAKTYTIRGVVKDKEKKDPIVGAVIRRQEWRVLTESEERRSDRGDVCGLCQWINCYQRSTNQV